MSGKEGVESGAWSSSMVPCSMLSITCLWGREMGLVETLQMHTSALAGFRIAAGVRLCSATYLCNCRVKMREGAWMGTHRPCACGIIHVAAKVMGNNSCGSFCSAMGGSGAEAVGELAAGGLYGGAVCVHQGVYGITRVLIMSGGEASRVVGCSAQRE